MNLDYLKLMPLSFVLEFMDSSLGMGYGTSLTPILILMGYEPLQIVPAVLLSQFFPGLMASIFHHMFKNVNFNRNSKDLKVALSLSIFAVFGTILSVFLAVNLPPSVLKILISVIVLSMGGVILGTMNVKPRFSWHKIIALGTVASINKGLSGGGYGPLVMGGQILSGIGVKNAIGITLFSESVTCFVGVLLYFLILSKRVDWYLALWLTAGTLLSVPISVYIVKRLPEKITKVLVSILILTLGSVTLVKVLFLK